MTEDRPEPKVEITLSDWADSKPVPFELKQEDIAEIHALMDKVGEKCEALGTSFTFSVVTRLDGNGRSQLQSRMGFTKGSLTQEMWVGQYIATGGLEALCDNIGDLLDAANYRDEQTKTLTLILPSTSIIV